MSKVLAGSLLALGMLTLSPAAVTTASAQTPTAAAINLIAAHGGHHHWRRCHGHRHGHRVWRHHRWVWIWHHHHHCHGPHGGHH